MIVPKYSRKQKQQDREAIAELALGVLADGWVKATSLAELVGVSVQQLHAALVSPVTRGVIDKRVLDIRVGYKEGRQARVLYRRGVNQPEPLPDWLSPEFLPPAGVLREIRVLGDE